MSQETPPAVDLQFSAKTARIMGIVAFVFAVMGTLGAAASHLPAIVGSAGQVVGGVAELLLLASVLVYRRAPSSKAPKVSE